MRSDAKANREAIITAAQQLFAAQGPDVTLSAIAARAGVGIATLYRRFPRRQDLVAGIAQDLVDNMLTTVQRYRPLVDQDPERYWSPFVRELADLRVGALLPDLVHSLGGTEMPPEIEAIRMSGVAAVDGVLTSAKLAGLVRSDVTAERFQSGLATVTRPLPRQLPINLTEQMRWLVDVYLRGLRP